MVDFVYKFKYFKLFRKFYNNYNKFYIFNYSYNNFKINLYL